MNARPEISSISSPRPWIDRYVAAGVWRRVSVVDDLRRWARETPDATAIVAHRPGEDIRRLSYREYGEWVDRFVGGLTTLGVQRGEVVALWLPSRWQLAALMLACWEVGAVIAPMMTTLGSREAERVLRRLGAVLCVTVDECAGSRPAALLAEMAPRLPALRRQVVLGTPGTGQHSFAERFEAAEAGVGPLDTVDPDRVSTVLFTSGTTGAPKAALHTLNTLFVAAASARAVATGPGEHLFTPHALAHAGGMGTALFATLPLGARTLLMEEWDPTVGGQLMADEGTTTFAGSPVFVGQLLDALPAGTRELPELARLFTIGESVTADLVRRVVDQLGVTLRTIWGMTEASNLATGPEDPPEWAVHSIGRPVDGLEVTVDGDGGSTVDEEHPGEMLVRGAGVCVATLGRDDGEVELVAEHDAGWYRTGDLVTLDGRGGYRLVGRLADRIRGRFMIPTLDVEEALRDHPGVADAALIGVPGDDARELACAVVTAATPDEAPTLADLRSFLLEQGMTEWYLPERLEVVSELPTNATGKVDKSELRRRFGGARR